MPRIAEFSHVAASPNPTAKQRCIVARSQETWTRPAPRYWAPCARPRKFQCARPLQVFSTYSRLRLRGGHPSAPWYWERTHALRIDKCRFIHLYGIGSGVRQLPHAGGSRDPGLMVIEGSLRDGAGSFWDTIPQQACPGGGRSST